MYVSKKYQSHIKTNLFTYHSKEINCLCDNYGDRNVKTGKFFLLIP